MSGRAFHFKLAHMTLKRSLISLTAVAVLALTGCSSHAEDATHSTASVDYSVYDANAVMFAQMMIPHHDQAITMADLALKKSSNPDVMSLANQIKIAQGPEIVQMTAWLQAAGAPLELAGDHSMHMDGMLSDAQLTALEDAAGTDFDKLFLESMIAHHEGALAMAQDLVANSSNAEVAALAAQIIENQSQEIAFMKDLLKQF